MGRRAQLSLFAENLLKDPEAEVDPAEFLFHVRGVGGVGKSTLLRQWQEAARRAGAVTAVVDEGDVHGVQPALAELARQITEQAGPLKEFDRAVEQYRQERETAAEAHAGGGGTGDNGVSVSSRVAAQAAFGAASLIPGAGFVAAMASPDVAAQGLDRVRARVRSRGNRGRPGDLAGVCRAFVAELGRLCSRHRWVVLFLDTWEQTGRYLDDWLRELLDEEFGTVPANVIIVLAGRDELAERDWAQLRAQTVDVPLEMFNEAETRELLAARGIVEPGVAEAVAQFSMGLPLVVELIARTKPADTSAVDADGEAVDAAVERFVQWIEDPWQRETVLACALAPQLNEDVFAAAAPPEARELWGWLCGQPFVSGHGAFKQYHAVVRASMVRQQRTHSPQRWRAAHLRLATTFADWRTATEQTLPAHKRWADARWRRHCLDETYHRLCADPAGELTAALEQAIQAAGRDTSVLRQWTDGFEQAASDSGDPVLLDWAVRLQSTIAADESVLAFLAAVLTHGQLSAAARAWARTYRGWHLHRDDKAEEAIAELDRAIAIDPHNARAIAYRGDVYRFLLQTEDAVADLTAALVLDPGFSWALGRRGGAYWLAGRFEEAVADLTAFLDLEPDTAWALAERGRVHRSAGRLEEAVADFAAALDLDPTYSWALIQRGGAHRVAGRTDQALADFTAALNLEPTSAWALAERGLVHRSAGRLEAAVADLTAALDLEPTNVWALAQRGETHRLTGRFAEAVADLTAALDLDSAYSWALAQRGLVHRSTGLLEEAVADLTAALALEPTMTWALTQRGETHRLAGSLQEAIADFTAALGLEPTMAWALAERGDLHRMASSFEEALADFTAALDLDPAYAWALARRGLVYRSAGRLEEALADLTAALELEPAMTWALAERGIIHRSAGRLEDAVADFTAALDLEPAYAWALAERGEAQRQAGRLEEALADLTAALDLEPAYAWALAERGEAQRQAGRLEEALADLTAALDLEPTNAWALARRGAVHQSAGRTDAAVIDLTAALDLEPTMAWALAERDRIHDMAGRLEEAVADFTTST